MNQNEAIIRALIDLGGEGTIQGIHGWLDEKHPNTWKDVGTALADMVPESQGGNSSSTVLEEFRVLKRVSRGRYQLLAKIPNV
jgi:hypothetical protein